MADQDTPADQDSLAPRRSQASDRQLPFRPSSIILVDHTKPPDPTSPVSPAPASLTDADDPGEASAARIRSGLSASLREHKQKWKYARYSEDRAAGRPGTAQSDDDGAASDRGGSTWGRTTFELQRRHLRDALRPRRGPDTVRGGADAGAEYDVLYENQRGAFLFGVPFFSSRALGQFEPAAWVDGSFRKSRVGVADAQLPDPSWRWAWRTWYVDMGRDVDEEGWEYSFFFRGFRWHGTHPWFHSFVRRRRWLRKRVRRRGRDGGDGEGAHRMNPEYFTIHSDKGRPLEGMSPSPSMSNKEWGVEENATWEELDMADLATLLRALKEAPVDSERISLIGRFLEQGGDDLNYLAKEIPTIVSYFFYENSVRRLLVIINDRLDTVQKAKPKTVNERSPGRNFNTRYIESLRKAADAVSQECEKLEFWSDVRHTTGKRTVRFSPASTNEEASSVEPEHHDSTDSTSDSRSDGNAKAEHSPDRADASSERGGLNIGMDSDAAVAAARESPAEGVGEVAGGDDDEPAVAV